MKCKVIVFSLVTFPGRQTKFSKTEAAQILTTVEHLLG